MQFRRDLALSSAKIKYLPSLIPKDYGILCSFLEEWFIIIFVFATADPPSNPRSKWIIQPIKCIEAEMTAAPLKEHDGREGVLSERKWREEEERRGEERRRKPVEE